MINGISIQWVFPCENPVDNVGVCVKRKTLHIEIPVNYPDIQNLTMRDLLDMQPVRKSLDLYRGLNTDISEVLNTTVIKMRTNGDGVNTLDRRP